MAKQYQVFQTQYRMKFDKEFQKRQAEGWELLGPVQFQIFREPQAATYYLATFVRDDPENTYHEEHSLRTAR